MSSLRLTYLECFFLDQAHSIARLEAVRLSIALTCLVLLVLGPYGHFYIDAVALFNPSRAFGLPPAAVELMPAARFCGIACSLLMLTRLPAIVPGLGLLVSFAFVDAVRVGFPSRLWAFTTHLLIFLFIVCLAMLRAEPRETPLQRLRSDAKNQAASFALAAMQVLVVLIYFQTGLSKLLHSGFEWFISGRTAMVFASQFGTPAGQSLLAWPVFFQIGSVAVGVLELGFPFFFLVPRLRRTLIAAAIGFHLSTLAILNISFWHLWLLFPALFFFRAYPQHNRLPFGGIALQENPRPVAELK